MLFLSLDPTNAATVPIQITVKDEGKSYAELLKSVKTNIAAEIKEAKCIKVIRKSKEGQLIIVVNNEDMESVKLLQAKVNRMEGAINTKARILGQHKGIPVFVKDIDGITSKREAVQAIEGEVGPDGLLCTGELRPYFGDNQALTVILKKDAAEALIRKGKIRIGLNRCSVSEKVAVPRCFKCWGYGHMAKECREQTDLSRACRKGGSLGAHSERLPECYILHKLQESWTPGGRKKLPRI